MSHIGCEHAGRTWLNKDDNSIIQSVYIKHMGWYGGFSIKGEYLQDFLDFPFKCGTIVYPIDDKPIDYKIEFPSSFYDRVKKYIIEDLKDLKMPEQKSWGKWQ